ncbi:MAG: hypothetical protein DYG88_07170 [Chloroflexi bacterium CFX4]|nr:hypothetical protein [Chloroflexi bacterium CFX4]MDL1922007.1 hypothetical protein [Chloroflexi bacterium CFX3]
MATSYLQYSLNVANIGVIFLLIQVGAPIAAQADDPCQTPNIAPTFLPRDSRSTPQPTRTPLPYDPCAPTATRSTSATGLASTPTPALPPVIPTPQLAANGLFGRYFTDTLTQQGSFDSFHATRLDPRLDFEWQQQPANPHPSGATDQYAPPNPHAPTNGYANANNLLNRRCRKC